MEEEPGLSVKEATRKAMREITAPIVAITLVLLSVFVPVAFIPGTSGELFRQFAVAVSAAKIGRASCRERVSVRVDLGGRRIITKKKSESKRDNEYSNTERTLRTKECETT